MIALFRALCILLIIGYAQAQTKYAPANQEFKSITTTLNNSNAWSLIVDQKIDLKFNPVAEVIYFDIKKIYFEQNPIWGLQTDKVCKLQFGISTVKPDGKWTIDFLSKPILLDQRIKVEPKIRYEIKVPPLTINLPIKLLNETSNLYRFTLQIFSERADIFGSPCDAHVPVHTPYLNNYLNDQINLMQQDIQYATRNGKDSEWIFCSKENNFCAFDGIGLVRFGVDGKYNYKEIAFEVGCTTAEFGDPVPSIEKKCEYKLNAPDSQKYEAALKIHRDRNDYEGWRLCAVEGGTCIVKQNSEIRYGISSFYNTKISSNNVNCDNQNFGDPIPGFLKKCFIKEKVQVSAPGSGSHKKLINAYALVIGNSAYAGSSRLANPVNDARAFSSKLKDLGFKVIEIADVDRSKFVNALADFSRTAADADLSLLFYAGHGVQITGINYMIPIDLNLNDLTQAPLQGISLSDVVEKYLPGKTKLVFLDACRDNPLMQGTGRGMSRGLAPISVSEGTLIAYATKDGAVAQDGDGKNSPFTSALLEHIGDPDDIAVVLRKVREKVMKATSNKQQPWEYGSLTGGALVLSAIKPK